MCEILWMYFERESHQVKIAMIWGKRMICSRVFPSNWSYSNGELTKVHQTKYISLKKEKNHSLHITIYGNLFNTVQQNKTNKHNIKTLNKSKQITQK